MEEINLNEQPHFPKKTGNVFYTLLCVVLKWLTLDFDLYQYKFGRKFYGGTWYYIYPKGLSTDCFWSDKIITSCQSEVVAIEHYT